jgi:predicted nucleic acid-binding protein
MTVIADTTPVNHLVLLRRADHLRKLYGRVIVPAAVLAELGAEAAPAPVRQWAASPPSWLKVRRVTVPPDRFLAALDPGEREAIVLAEYLHADVLLMDDLGGRREAERRHLNVTGTLTVLFLAAERGLLDDFPATLQQLQQTGFRASSRLLKMFLDRYSGLSRGSER